MPRTRPELDNYCRSIFLYLLIGNQKIRYNDLLKGLKKSGIDISKPTLSKHLKELINEGLIKKNVEDVQIVSYQVNPSVERTLKGNLERADRIHRQLIKDEKEFQSLSTEGQLRKVLDDIAIREINKLKARVLYEISPTFENSMTLLLWESNLFRKHEKWFIQKCKDDESYRENALNRVDEAMETILDAGEDSNGST